MDISKKRFILNILLALILVSIALSICFIPEVTFAEENNFLQNDGLYFLQYETINSKFEPFIKGFYAEKSGNNYYLSLRFSKDVTSCKIGESEIKYGLIENNSISGANEYIFTVTKDMFLSPINVILRGEKIQEDNALSKGFTLKIKKNSLINKTGEFRDLGERPALYEADFNNIAGNENIEIDTNYKLPKATATLGGENVAIETKVYYRENANAELQKVSIVDGAFKVDKKGQYVIKYKVESNKYKTSLGNNLVNTEEAIINVVDKIVLPCDKDGLYLVKYTFDAKMGSEYFRDTVVLEKKTLNDKAYYFVTLSVGYQKDTGMDAMQDVELILDDCVIGSKGPWADSESINLGLYGDEHLGKNEAYKNITYSIPEDMLKRRLSFKGTVPMVGLRVGFGVVLHMDPSEWTYKQADLLNIGNRPPEYLPLINVLAGSTEKEKGSYVTVPHASATIIGEEIPVITKVTFGENEEVSVKDNKFQLEKEGKYYITFTATSDKVKDMYGNAATAVIKSTIVSKVGAMEAVRIIDSGIIAPNETVQGMILDKETSGYRKVKNAIESVTDRKKENRYTVYGVGVYDEHNKPVSIEGRGKLYIGLALNEEYKEKNVKVYYLNGNDLELQNVSFEDGYAVLNTDKTGTFVIVEEGYKLSKMQKMMIGGGVGAGLLVILIIIIVVVVVVKKKKKQKKTVSNKKDEDIDIK